MERLLNIWKERNLYRSDFIQQLTLAIEDSTSPQPTGCLIIIILNKKIIRIIKSGHVHEQNKPKLWPKHIQKFAAVTGLVTHVTCALLWHQFQPVAWCLMKWHTHKWYDPVFVNAGFSPRAHSRRGKWWITLLWSLTVEEKKPVKRTYQKIHQEEEEDEDDDYRSISSPRNTDASANQLVRRQLFVGGEV